MVDTSQFGISVNDFKCIKRMDAIIERYRNGKIPIEKLSFSVSTKVEVFPWIDKWLGIAIQNYVKDLEFGYMDSGYSTLLYLDPLPVFTMLTAKSLRKLVLKDCDLTKATLWSSGSVATYYDSLRELSLLGVRLNDNMLQTLLATCPMIVHFTIKHCVGLSKIELRNLQMIKMNLKSLKLSCVKISDGFIEHLTSRCEFLECLMLDNIVSKGLKRFKVCGRQSLKKLVIRGCNGIAMIDAPNLESLEYVGHQVPVLKTAKTFGPLKNSRIELYRVGNLNALWFCKLRKFLFNSNSLLHITLHFPKCNKIDMQNWDPYRGLFDIPQIDVLNVHLTGSVKCQTFVDALLWSCHPGRRNLFSTVQMITCFNIHLMRMRSSTHSTSRGSCEPWQCQIKRCSSP
ncbi:hypothetical protein CQW23_25515 [Capsicum baccatum]|uniref:F-box/LRR-repeat protein 15/At3g58940/PEG3-like LRR domain-containing protein n=1 Tax=Capsicum baccatum TaxID=33114 RepID=A0A2G2VL54_CAPBA|nr:hypothetical protein CQW23_25515 [Capsicum baccatum]